jgi:5-methyltetrahydropteroyltriglutamate--homocysteine methyltransferase
VLEKTFNFKGVTKQIHLHSASNLHDLLNAKNIDVLSFEYAASPRNIEAVSKKMLDSADKQIRVGISRTDIDAIIAEQNEKGITQPVTEQLIESEETIKRRFKIAKEKYGDRLMFTGPDCGLSGWPSQEAAQALLERTVRAVQSVQSGTNLK